MINGTDFNNLKLEYQRNINGSFFNQDYEYFTFDIGFTNEQGVKDKYNEIINDTDFHIRAQKMGLDMKSILTPDGKLSFVNLRFKIDLIETLIMSDRAIDLKMREVVNKITKNDPIQIDNQKDLLAIIAMHSPNDFQEIITACVTKLINFGIPAINILMVKVENKIVDTSDGTEFDINEFMQKVSNGDYSDIDLSSIADIDSDNGKASVRFGDVINALAKKGHYIKHEIELQIILNKYFEASKETCIEYMSKMNKIEEKISDSIIKNVTINLGLEKGKINLESVLNDIQERLFESQMKSDPIIRFTPDNEAPKIMDLIIQSNECMMKQELKDVVDSIGYSYIEKQLAIGSTLLVRGIYIPNRINKNNPFEVIDITNFSKQGCFYIVLERHPGNGNVLRKIFNGKYHGIAQIVADFIIKNEAILLQSVK